MNGSENCLGNYLTVQMVSSICPQVSEKDKVDVSALPTQSQRADEARSEDKCAFRGNNLAVAFWQWWAFLSPPVKMCIDNNTI